MGRIRTVFALACAYVGCVSVSTAWKIPKDNEGYDTRWKGYSETKLNVHLVPHTHDDVGWLKTVDQYYYGSNNSIQSAKVQYILDSVIQELHANPDRKFMYVEQAFFTRWWHRQGKHVKKITRKLIKNGQLEFVNGGWCMHDEATTHYVAMIDQMTLGHQFLKNEFDYVPQIGWQIDTFGHSSTQGSLLSAGIGFNAIYFARVDYEDYNARRANKTLEFLWEPNRSLKTSIFTGIMQDHYESPPGFNFEQDDPIMDDTTLDEFNLNEKITDFIQTSLNRGAHTKGKHIMIVMGSDFSFSNSRPWFLNMDKLIHYVNQDPRINIFYSTPTQYTKAKYLERDVSYTTKHDDFFPYGDAPHAYWVGYFTSRPALKLYTRIGSGILQIARQLEVLAQSHSKKLTDNIPTLNTLERAIAVVQHHDGVSGTSKQHVANDYTKRIANGINEAENVIALAIQQLLADDPGTPSFCWQMNTSQCAFTANHQEFQVLLYNPVAIDRNVSISFPVYNPNISITANTVKSQSTSIEFDIVPTFTKPKLNPLSIPLPYWIHFTAFLPSLGFTSYTIHKVKSVGTNHRITTVTTNELSSHLNSPIQTNSTIHTSHVDDVVQINTSSSTKNHQGSNRTNTEKEVLDSIYNSRVKLEFSKRCGHVRYLTSYAGNPANHPPLKVQFHHSFYYYTAIYDRIQSSGAYIFRPDNVKNALNVMKDNEGNEGDDGNNSTYCLQYEKIVGQSVSELRLTLGDGFYQVYRVHKDAPFIEVTYYIDKVNLNIDNSNIAEWRDLIVGKDIITKYSTDLKSNGVFHTDSNCFDFIQRVRNKCNDTNNLTTQNTTSNTNNSADSEYNLKAKLEPIASNYYPVTCGIYIRDDVQNVQLTVLTDRAQGGSSLLDGNIELMLHRRILVDDSKGVNEALNEPNEYTSSNTVDGLQVYGKHYLVLNRAETSHFVYKPLMEEIFLPYLPLFYPKQQRLHQYYDTTSNSDNDNDDKNNHNNANGESDIDHSTEVSSQRSLYESHLFLPKYIQLITLQQINRYKLVLRLGHRYAHDVENNKLNTPIQVDIKNIFQNVNFHVVSAIELSLTTNQLQKTMESHKYTYWHKASQDGNNHYDNTSASATVTTTTNSAAAFAEKWKQAQSLRGIRPWWMLELKPLEIKTLELFIESK